MATTTIPLVRPAERLAEDQLHFIPITELRPHPHNVRRVVDDLEEMIESISEKGVLEPLLVLPDRTVVIGHRRMEAAKRAWARWNDASQGLQTDGEGNALSTPPGVRSTVPCIVRDMTEAEQIETMLVENLQRVNITPVEEAEAYQALLDLGVEAGEISAKVGSTAERIRTRTALLGLPNKARKMLEDGLMTLTAAEELLVLKDYPAEMDRLVENTLKNRYVRDPSEPLRHFWDAKDKLQSIKNREAKAATVKKLKAAGTKISKMPPDYGRKNDDPIEIGKPEKNGGFYAKARLEVPLAAHKKLECHAVAVSPTGKTVNVCTNPTSHKEYKRVKAGPMGGYDYEAEQRKREAERREAAVAAAQRRALLRERIAGDPHDAIRRAASLTIAGRDENHDHLLCELLDLVPASQTENPDAVDATQTFVEWLCEGGQVVDGVFQPLPLHRDVAAAAIIFLEADQKLAWNEPMRPSLLSIHHVAYLREMGYEPRKSVTKAWAKAGWGPEAVANRVSDPDIAFTSQGRQAAEDTSTDDDDDLHGSGDPEDGEEPEGEATSTEEEELEALGVSREVQEAVARGEADEDADPEAQPESGE